MKKYWAGFAGCADTFISQYEALAYIIILSIWYKAYKQNNCRCHWIHIRWERLITFAINYIFYSENTAMLLLRGQHFFVM